MRLFLVIVCSVLATSCVDPAPAEHGGGAITAGWLDDEDAAVVGLAAEQRVFCTGALVTPIAVLTAAHCLVPTGPTEVIFGPSLAEAEQTVPVAALVPHPRFDPATLANDIALVILDVPVLDEPLAMLRRPLGASDVGMQLRLVGYGLRGRWDTAEARKRAGGSHIDALEPTRYRIVPAPSQTCVGDSGGPSLVAGDDGLVVVGVHSAGDAGCEEEAYDTRVDAAFDEFLEPETLRHALVVRGQSVPSLTGGCASAPTAPAFPGLALVLLAVVGLRRRQPVLRGAQPAAADRAVGPRRLAPPPMARALLHGATSAQPGGHQ